MVSIAVILLFILIAAAISRRIQGTIITMPMVCVVLGLALSDLGLGLVEPATGGEFIRILAELTLVLVLASDASRIPIRGLIKNHNFPIRLLGIGLPLTMIAGTILAALIFENLNLAEAAILGILLAPTDASLGQAVMTNKLVPQRIRQALNVESGLNDGIAMPFLLLALVLATAEEFGGFGSWIQLGVIQIVMGAVCGAAVGFLGAKFLNWGEKSGWMTEHFRKISAITLALLAYVIANLLDGNGFIAAFVLGITMRQFIIEGKLHDLSEHVEVEVDLLILLTFMIVFGAYMLPDAIRLVDWKIILYALLSLTLVRLLPVAISLLGMDLRKETIGFIGWFGPRGTASILYLFTVIEEESLRGLDTIYAATLITVFLSVFAHGMSAAPAASWYGRVVGKKMPDEAAELQQVPSLPTRIQPKSE